MDIIIFIILGACVGYIIVNYFQTERQRVIEELGEIREKLSKLEEQVNPKKRRRGVIRKYQ